MLDYKNKNISIGIINLRLNNIFSIINILKNLGFKVEIIDKKKRLKMIYYYYLVWDHFQKLLVF